MPNTIQVSEYLAATFYIDHQSRAVLDFVAANRNESDAPMHQAIDLFYAVRDGWHYSPDLHEVDPAHLKASILMERPTGHCLDKAVILIACYRAAGIPARLHLVKVKNHIAAENLIQKLGTDELTPHAYVEVEIEGEWTSVTPAFNRSLCEKLDVEPLEFDGKTACLFQQFSKTGDRFMEYLDDYGTFSDYPYDFVKQNLIAHYPAVAAYYGE